MAIVQAAKVARRLNWGGGATRDQRVPATSRSRAPSVGAHIAIKPSMAAFL